jgi:hypothetical protein
LEYSTLVCVVLVLYWPEPLATMAEKKPKQQAVQIRLSTAAIVDGKYFAAGTVLPFEKEADVPPNLKEHILTGEPEDGALGEPTASFQPNTLYQLTSDGRMGRAVLRQAAQVNAGLQEQAWCEAQAELDQQLPVETQTVLEDLHNERIALLKARRAHDLRLTDAAEKAANETAKPAAPPEFRVQRGKFFVACEGTRLKPGENVFAKFAEAGGWQVVGQVNALGEPPEQLTII